MKALSYSSRSSNIRESKTSDTAFMCVCSNEKGSMVHRSTKSASLWKISLHKRQR